jgi:hypothetical protein
MGVAVAVAVRVGESPVEHVLVRELYGIVFEPAPVPDEAPDSERSTSPPGGECEPDAPWLPPLFQPVDHTPPPLDPAAAAFVATVDSLVAQDPAVLSEAVAEQRASTVLQQIERLAAVTSDAIADVEARELFTKAAAGSTRAWLRASICGDRGQLSLARRLRCHRAVRDALADGRVGSASAAEATSFLDALPDAVDEEQLQGVLENALPDLLREWTGQSLLVESPTPEQRANAALLQSVIAEGLASVGTPAQRLEPACVLLAQALTVSHLGGALQQIRDALDPAVPDDRDDEAYMQRSARLVKKRFTPGYRLEAHLTDEDGARLQARLAAAADAESATAEAIRVAVDESDEGSPASGEDDAEDDAEGGAQAGVTPPDDQGSPGPGPDPHPDPPDFGAAGPGLPPLSEPADPFTGPPPGTPVEGDRRARAQREYDAFISLLLDPGGGTGPPPVQTVVSATLPAIEARVGALPGTLLSQTGGLTLSRAAVRRLSCNSALTAVLLDAAGRPIGASHSRRLATDRERRALLAQWGSVCAVNGCSRRWTVPHHVEPYWLSGRTRLADLIGICEGCHHDVHTGRRTLRLRDGRLIDELGWVA